MKLPAFRLVIFLLLLAGWVVALWVWVKPVVQADWLVWQGNVAFEKAGFGDAEVAFRKATALAPFRNSHYNLGNSLYRQGRVSEAIQEYLAQLKVKDEALKAEALFNLGNAFFATGDTLKSLEAFKEALLLKPEDGQARQNFLYVWRARQAQLRKEERAAHQKEPQNAKENTPETQAKAGEEEKGKPGSERQEDNTKLSDKNIEDLLSQIRKNEEAARGKINKSKQRNQKLPPGELDY